MTQQFWLVLCLQVAGSSLGRQCWLTNHKSKLEPFGGAYIAFKSVVYSILAMLLPSTAIKQLHNDLF